MIHSLTNQKKKKIPSESLLHKDHLKPEIDTFFFDPETLHAIELQEIKCYQVVKGVQCSDEILIDSLSYGDFKQQFTLFLILKVVSIATPRHSIWYV